jgi:hypothetical protein
LHYSARQVFRHYLSNSSPNPTRSLAFQSGEYATVVGLLLLRWERFGNFSLFTRKILIAESGKQLIFNNFGAGDGDRTRDGQLGKLTVLALINPLRAKLLG